MSAASPVAVLARQETRRVFLHPISILGWSIYLVTIVRATLDVDAGPREAFTNADSLLTAYPGMFLILLGNLLAHRDLRAGTTELLGSVPVRAVDRTGALLLTAVPLVATGVVMSLVVHVVNRSQRRYDTAAGDAVPELAHLLQAPITLAGALCLGVMVARWSSARVAIVLVIVAMVVLNAWLNGRDTGIYFGPMMSWADWGPIIEVWHRRLPGNPWWHLGYLVGLTSLAALGSLLFVSRRPSRIVALGLLALGFTALSGWAMLP